MEATEKPETRVRNALREWLQERGETGELLVEEFWIPQCFNRADLVTVSREEMHAYELKTETDNLRRLDAQCLAYGYIFDRCTAVVARRHWSKVELALPPWWGVITIEAGGGFQPHRPAARNPAVKLPTVSRLLWKAELVVAVSGTAQVATSGYSADDLRQQLLDIADPEEVRFLVREFLIARDPAKAKFPSRRYQRQKEEMAS